LFSELPFEESRRVAELANERIEDRTISMGFVNQMRETYEGLILERKSELKPLAEEEVRPI
jgi:hypothetical protein